MITTGRAAGVGVVLALALAGCGESSPPSASPGPAGTTPAPSATSSPSATRAGCQPAFTADALPDSGTAAGGILGLKAATSAVHTGYDRVVFTFGGSAQPGWRVEYVPSASSDGSGDPVAVQGPKVLRVILKDVGYPGDTGVPDPAIRRFTPTGTVGVREVVLDTVFEGQYTAFIGVDATRPFRVFRLAGPPRVVVDVRHC